VTRVVVLVNEVPELTPIMATTLIGLGCARRWPTWFVGVSDVAWVGGRLVGRGVRAADEPSTAFVARAPGAEQARVELGSGDLLLLRTNPARDPDRAMEHKAALHLAVMARDQGVTVLNDPESLERVGSKLFLLELGEDVRPRQVVSASLADLRAFADAEDGPVVLKPLWGTRGIGVVKVDAGDAAGLEAAAGELLADGHVVAQEYLPEAPAGDVRVLMLEGAPITVDGHRAAVRRVPAPGEFRSNVHLGGTPAPAAWSEALETVSGKVGPELARRGIFLAGLDVVGRKVVEVNVFAPGGFQNAGQQAGVDFLEPVLDALERRLG